MQKKFPSEKVYSALSKIHKAGWGVFAKVAIKKGELIEECPILEISQDDTSHIHEESLVSYLFYFGDKREKSFIALGFGSLYNHTNTPNAKYKIKSNEHSIAFRAIQAIAKDEEITISYTQENKEKTPLWFEI